MAGVERLETRRINACKKFVEKQLKSERYSEWFKERPVPLRGNRRGIPYRIYEEEIARTDRRMNSPIFYYRRLANEMNG
jgi:hypothetical protein